MTAPLPKPLRTQLENTVKAAREIAEQAAGAALVQLAVGEDRAPDYLSESQLVLRRRLRAHGRALGDLKAQNETQGVRHLVWEVAYKESLPYRKSPHVQQTVESVMALRSVRPLAFLDELTRRRALLAKRPIGQEPTP